MAENRTKISKQTYVLPCNYCTVREIERQKAGRE